MATVRKSIGIRKQIAAQLQHTFEVSERLEEQIIFERLKQSDRDVLDSMLREYQRYYGLVSYQYWLRAVVRSMKENITKLNKVLVYELLSRSESDRQKLKFLDVMAKQMGADVTITNNRALKPARVYKPRISAPKAKRGPGERGPRI